MSRILFSPSARRALALGIGPGFCIGSILRNRAPIRLDSTPATASSLQRQISSTGPSPDVVRQIAGGSITGLGVGLTVALFSRTLAFFSGLFTIAIHLASRFGFDVTRLLGARKFLEKTSLWKKTRGNPWFTASFALTFTLAAFVHL